MRSLLQDVRYAARTLLKSPGFTAVAVITLALGIGANTAIFSVMDALLLRNLPVGHPEQLALLGRGRHWGMISGITRSYEIFSYPQYRAFRERSQSFSGLCAFGSEDEVVKIVRAGSGGAAETAVSKLVSGNYFSVLQVPATLGRTLLPEDDRPGATPVVVLSHRYWANVYHREPGAVGQTLEVNGTPFTIVGVAPPGFFGEMIEANPPEMWMPIAAQPRVVGRAGVLEGNDKRWLWLMGRLRPGATLAQASTELTLQLHQFLLANAGSNPEGKLREQITRARIDVTPGGTGVSHLRFEYSEPLRILFAIVGLVLAIACANLANILLARGTTRQREISIRVALGAGRWRLLRQLLTESVLLSLLGGAAGLLVALWGTRLLLAAVFRGARTVVISTSPDLRMLGFTLAASVAAGILFGLAPALRASRVELSSSLKTGAQPGQGRGRFGVGRLLVVAQAALSLLLIVGAGLFLRTLMNLVHRDFGFDREHVLLVKIDPRLAGYKPVQLEGLYGRIRERIDALPGVRNSGMALYTPLNGENWSGNVAIADFTREQNGRAGAAWNRVSAGYFETAGIPVLLGRGIGPQDTADAPDVAVINQTFAREFFQGQNPVGKRIGWSDDNKAAIEIVGVVKDTRHDEMRGETPAMFFLPFTQKSGLKGVSEDSDPVDRYARDLLVRTSGDPAHAATEVRQALREVDAGIPVLEVTTLKEQVSASMNREELIGGLAAFFGALALLLAALGLYGLMAYAVARRTSEIGVRMALGARLRHVLWMVLRETLLLVSVGIAAGVPLVLAASRLVRNQLYGVAPNDPVSLLAGGLLLACLAALAGYIPARRASKIDPMVALRYE